LTRRLPLSLTFAIVGFALALSVQANPQSTQVAAAKQTPVVAKTSSAAKKTAAATPAAVPAPALITVNGITDIDPTKTSGQKNAPLIMEVFTDFQCPACKQLYLTTLQKVTENYANTGKVYIVHRDFPLQQHAYSRVAANYARAAAHIGRDDAVELVLFQNQEKWEANGDVKGTLASVLSPAEMKKVDALVDSKTLDQLVEKDRQLGVTAAVNQTPTSVIHGKNGQVFPVVGFVSYENFKAFLDQLLAQ
jgi:protein-disulfide isomerase